MDIIILVVFAILYLVIYLLKEFLDDKFFSRHRHEKAEKRCMEQSKKIKGICVVECQGTNYCYQNGRKVSGKPIYKKPDGTYCTYDDSTHKYAGYCKNGRFSKYDKLDKYGVKQDQLDEHGNKYFFKNPYPINYVPNEEEETSSFNKTSYNDGGSYINDDEPYQVHQTFGWRSDGSYGDMYDVGGVPTDEWGNPL